MAAAEFDDSPVGKPEFDWDAEWSGTGQCQLALFGPANMAGHSNSNSSGSDLLLQKQVVTRLLLHKLSCHLQEESA